MIADLFDRPVVDTPTAPASTATELTEEDEILAEISEADREVNEDDDADEAAQSEPDGEVAADVLFQSVKCIRGCGSQTMKFGIRKPSIRKSFAARTSVKRMIRSELGLRAPRGWRWLTNPKKAAYNRVYNRTSVSFWSILRRLFK